MAKPWRIGATWFSQRVGHPHLFGLKDTTTPPPNPHTVISSESQEYMRNLACINLKIKHNTGTCRHFKFKVLQHRTIFYSYFCFTLEHDFVQNSLPKLTFMYDSPFFACMLQYQQFITNGMFRNRDSNTIISKVFGFVTYVL